MIYSKILLPIRGADTHARALIVLAHTLPLAQVDIILLPVIAPLSKAVADDSWSVLLTSAT